MENSINKMMARKNKLEINIRKLETRMSNYKKEYEELETAIEVIKRFGVDVDSVEPASAGSSLTIGDMAVTVLKEKGALAANDILEEIQGRWKPDLARTSLSPPLSRLKDKKIVDYDEDTGRWYLPKDKGSSDPTPEPSTNFEQGDEFEEEIPF